MARLSSTRRGPFKSKTATDPARTTSFLAIPTAAYANAYADMRSPPAAALPNPFASGIAGMKNLPFPSFALQQVVSAEHGPSQPRPRASVTMADRAFPAPRPRPHAHCEERSLPMAASVLVSVGCTCGHKVTCAVTRDACIFSQCVQDAVRTNHYHSGDHAAVGGIKLGIPYALLKASSTPQARFTTSKLLASSQQASSSPGATAAQADSVLKELAGIHTATGGPRPLGLAELSLDTASDAKGQAMTRIATKYAHTAMHVAKTMTDPLNGPRDDEVAVSPVSASPGMQAGAGKKC